MIKDEEKQRAGESKERQIGHEFPAPKECICFMSALQFAAPCPLRSTGGGGGDGGGGEGIEKQTASR